MSASAYALDYTVGGGLNGTSTVSGPTNASYNGLNVPCNASFTVSDSAGSGSVTGASFSGSSSCTAIRACNLPWSIGKPLASAGTTNNTRISGVCVYIPSPINQTCTGIVTGTLKSGGTFTFTGSLAPSSGVGICGVNSRIVNPTYPNGLVSSPVLGIL
jgi:hypothetical protein